MVRVLFCLLGLLPTLVGAALDPLVDVRLCGDPLRNANGTIHRSSVVTAMFQRLHPCPSTGETTGPCPGWQKDHVIPLANGGCDAVFNLQWLPTDVKTCGLPHCKDRFERMINAVPVNIVP